ncbi:MAG: flagellar biosynthesis anti-sigma factor FlgM [Limnochordaceae bacterium]|nr:flagellar biosynthesis anti-sigma factor FlgM [Limnochordaceae bacterium]
MKISINQIASVYRLYRIEQQTSHTTVQATREAGAPADQVTISKEAQHLRELHQKVQAQLASVPEIRSDRVAELRAALLKGTYQVPASAVAEKMLGRALADRLR